MKFNVGRLQSGQIKNEVKSVGKVGKSRNEVKHVGRWQSEKIKQ
jgi:hypothetical protein